MPIDQQERTNIEQTQQVEQHNNEQRTARNTLYTHTAAALTYETTQTHRIQLERTYTPTQQELAALENKTGENLYWERLSSTSVQAREAHRQQELQKTEYLGKTTEEQQALLEEHWRQANVRWIRESNQQADTQKRIVLIQGLKAVGIDVLSPGDINDNLDRFLDTYGAQQDGAKKYVAAITNACNNPDGGFDYVKFTAIKEALQDFTTGNFGNTQQIEELFNGYLDAYVTIEYTMHNPNLKTEVTTNIIEKTQRVDQPVRQNNREQQTQQQLEQRRTELENLEHQPFEANFIRPLEESLRRAGIHVEYVNPVPIGEGKFHRVFTYNEPNKPKRVIKIPKPNELFAMTESAQEHQENINLSKRIFSEYVVDTTVAVDPQDTQKYYILQDLVEGQPVTKQMCTQNPDLKRQLAEIARQNKGLYRDEKTTLDIVGFAALGVFAKRQFKKLFNQTVDPSIANILVDQNGKLKIIDFEYFHTDSRNLKKKGQAILCMNINNWFMKHYFDLNIIE